MTPIPNQQPDRKTDHPVVKITKRRRSVAFQNCEEYGEGSASKYFLFPSLRGTGAAEQRLYGIPGHCERLAFNPLRNGKCHEQLIWLPGYCFLKLLRGMITKRCSTGPEPEQSLVCSNEAMTSYGAPLSATVSRVRRVGKTRDSADGLREYDDGPRGLRSKAL